MSSHSAVRIDGIVSSIYVLHMALIDGGLAALPRGLQRDGVCLP